MARCLYCGKTLWLRLSSRGSEFCSEEHRRQHDELVLARLQADEAADPATPAEGLGPLLDSAPFPEESPKAGENERVPMVAGFRQIGPEVALALKSQPRHPTGFRRENFAWRSLEVWRQLRPVPAPVVELPVSPMAGVVRQQPAVAWQLSVLCLAVSRKAAPCACRPQASNRYEIRLGSQSAAARNSRALARGEWRWRGVLPIHSASVVEPLVGETPRPARLIGLHIAFQAPACTCRRPSFWSHPAVAIPAQPFTLSSAILSAQPRPVLGLPQDNRVRIRCFGDVSVWRAAAPARSTQVFPTSAAILPAPAQALFAVPQDDQAPTLRFDIRVAVSPIVSPRLKARPAGFPVLRQDELDSFVEPEPLASPRSRIAWARSRWSAAPRLVRVAVLAFSLVGAGVPLVTRIPPALRTLHWQHPALARQIENTLQQRAVIQVVEDFRSGLSGWEGGPEWSERWSYDPAGFVHPGSLALLTGSRPFADYRLEFLGLIDRKGIGWVFRAADLENYYAIKIVISRPGPLPRAVLVRYVVAGGVALEHVRLPLPMSIRIGRFYRIETSAYQDRFVTSIDGRVVDAFFDSRHRAGGVGLFSEPGEDARVMALRVADRDDFVGRLCAYFLGHSADTSNEATRSVGRADPGGIERK